MRGSSILWMRLLLALISVFFAGFLGRAAARFYRGLEKRSSTISWSLRTTAALLAVCWHGLDWLALAAAGASLAAAGVGARAALKPPEEEHLEKVIFPEE